MRGDKAALRRFETALEAAGEGKKTFKSAAEALHWWTHNCKQGRHPECDAHLLTALGYAQIYNGQAARFEK